MTAKERVLPPEDKEKVKPDIETDLEGRVREEFPSNHLDRAMAFIKGEDNRDYLLVDESYYAENKPPWGAYAEDVQKACAELDVNLVVIDSQPEDVLYALNLVQFEDRSIFMSKGAPSLERIVREIVGENRVFTTTHPVIYFPMLRKGGIRCLTLNAPKRMFRPRDTEH
jgi:hypothetical protein